ncbi:putative polar tube protein 3 (PTP3), partial [Tubulinosema ratisbonensis]
GEGAGGGAGEGAGGGAGEGESEEMEDLGVVDAIPDDAKEVDITDGELKFPLKRAKRSKQGSGEEEESEDQDDAKRGDKLRNKITLDDIPSKLNKIKGNDGYYNIPESAKKLDIADGDIVYTPDAKKEMEKDGDDTSDLKKHHNKGEMPDMPLGEPYYVRKIKGGELKLPTPKDDTVPENLKMGKKCVKLKNPAKILIKKGKVELTPWKDFSKLLRPILNFANSLKCLGKPPEECKEPVKKDLIHDKHGKPLVVLTPKLGVPETVPVEDLNFKPSNIPGEVGQDGMPDHSNTSIPSPKRSLNIAKGGKNKPQSIEDAFVDRNIKKAKNQRDTAKIISKKNPFIFDPALKTSPNVKLNAPPEQPKGPTKVIEMKKTDLIKDGKVIGKKTKLVTARPGSLSPPQKHDPCPTGQKMSNAVKSILFDNADKFSKATGMKKKEFIDKFKVIPDTSLQTIFQYQCKSNDPGYLQKYANAYKDLQALYDNKTQPFAKVLGNAILMAQKRLNPNKSGTTKIVKKPSVVKKGPRNVSIKKKGKNIKKVTKEQAPNALKSTQVRK